MLNILFSSIFAAAVLAAPVEPGKANLTSWSAPVGTKWQIILSQTLSPYGSVTPSDAKVWDLDLFNTPASTIQMLKLQGKTVMCYFSAGTSEQGRDDLGGLQYSDYGAGLPDWPGEKWLNLRSNTVWNVMAARVALAAQKGCDAIDPDNMDGYSNENGGGFYPPLSTTDSVNFLRKLASTANSYGLAIGVKNSQEILSYVQPYVQFAVNEECIKFDGCADYSGFISAGKPVFHIEYGSYSSLYRYCSNQYFSTVVKTMDLSGWVAYCDGSQATTPTTG